MLFKADTIIFLQRSGLLITGKRMSSVRFEFPADMVQNLEVTQAEKLTSACQQFFSEHGLRGKRVILVLDYSVVFEKTIALDKTGQPDKLLEGFVAAMPFDTGKRACLGVEAGSELHLYATNVDLYSAIEAALQAANVSGITAITPIAAYGLGDKERTLSAATTRILKDASVSKQANFHDITAS